MNLEDYRNLFSIVQSVATTLAFVVAAGAAYSSGLFAQALQIRFDLTQVIARADRKIAVVTVTVKNVGRRRIRILSGFYGVAPIDDQLFLEYAQEAKHLTSPVNWQEGAQPIFEEGLALPREQEESIDIYIPLQESPTFVLRLGLIPKDPGPLDLWRSPLGMRWQHERVLDESLAKTDD